MQQTDILILGAGAAGLFCAALAGSDGKQVVVLDHAKKPGEKIRISGGGRCNFTNLYCGPESFISANPHFCKSALARFTPFDFIDLVEAAGISWHEKEAGQLFCDGKATQITDMLLHKMRTAGVELRLDTEIREVRKTDSGFQVTTGTDEINTRNLVVATGGLSIPKMGATGFGHKLAQQFGLNVVVPQAALAPFRLSETMLAETKPLSGTSVDVRAMAGGKSFDGPMLFTHRGLSGPALLQVSSYWSPGAELGITFRPDLDRNKLTRAMQNARTVSGKQTLGAFLGEYFPGKLAALLAQRAGAPRMGDLGNAAIKNLLEDVLHWQFTPVGTEGYRTAEVTRGGVDTAALSSRSLQVKGVPGLYFIGEVVDVTGHLGGHNFQWAWASAHACAVSLNGTQKT